MADQRYFIVGCWNDEEFARVPAAVKYERQAVHIESDPLTVPPGTGDLSMKLIDSADRPLYVYRPNHANPGDTITMPERLVMS
jgi:hypothetical protein